MSAPETIAEARKRLVDECSYSDPHGMLLIDPWASAEEVFKWRAEWLRDVEPRLRSVSEKPQVGDVIAIPTYSAPTDDADDDFTLRTWRRDSRFSSACQGWILLERAKPKTLAEEARGLLARKSEVISAQEGCLVSAKWTADVMYFIRRVAEQEKRGE